MIESEQIALLGGSSPLGKDLRAQLESRGSRVDVFSRSASSDMRSYQVFTPENYSVVVNLIGGHKLNLAESDVSEIVELSTSILRKCSNAGVTYVHLSSGIVGQAPLGHADGSLYHELKSRLELVHEESRGSGAPVVDLRLFSFAGSHFLKESNYFLGCLRQAIVSGREVTLNGRGFLRDFSGPSELAMAIAMAHLRKLYGSYDIHSAAPVTRLQILEALASEFGVKANGVEYEEDDSVYVSSPSRRIPGFGPRKSVDVVLEEMRSSLSSSL